MSTVIVDNIHLYKTNSGIFYSPSIVNDEFLSRYTESFSNVKIVAKVKLISIDEIENKIKVSLSEFEIIELPFFSGLIGFTFNFFKIYKKLLTIDSGDLILYRMSQLESLIVFLLHRKNKFILEIVNDPNLFLRGIKKLLTKHLLNKMIIEAEGISCITRYHIENSYPNIKLNKNLFFYSTIDVKEDEFQKPSFKEFNEPIKILHVSNNIIDDSKGHYGFLKVLKILNDRGVKFEALVIGDGSGVDKLKIKAKELGISDSVNFKGRISDKKLLLNYYRTYDFFLYPTRTDLQGRVNIEAISNGLVVISTLIGGIPEIIETECLFKLNDYYLMANKIIELTNNPQKALLLSNKNYIRSVNFSIKINSLRRASFYKLFNSKENY